MKLNKEKTKTKLKDQKNRNMRNSRNNLFELLWLFVPTQCHCLWLRKTISFPYPETFDLAKGRVDSPLEEVVDLWNLSRNTCWVGFPVGEEYWTTFCWWGVGVEKVRQLVWLSLTEQEMKTNLSSPTRREAKCTQTQFKNTHLWGIFVYREASDICSYSRIFRYLPFLWLNTVHQNCRYNSKGRMNYS